MEVTLSLDDMKEKNEGYQKKLEESKRLELYNVFNEQPVRRGRRGGFRGRRGGFRGGFRARSRGAGFRRGFRGNNRGRGMRGNRGGNRGTK